MAIVAFKDVSEIVNDIVSGRKKAITYGLSIETRRQYMLPIKFAISANEKGIVEHPLIRPIESLTNEDPEKTVIVAATFPIEAVWESVSKYGDFTVINYFTLDFIFGLLPALSTLPVTYRRTYKLKTARRGIVVRGAYMGANGFQAIQKLAADHPDDYIVISTWDTVPAADLEQLETVCDRLVLNKLPLKRDPWNRNVQLACIQPGVQALIDAGVERMLVVRSDYLFGDPFMLEVFDALLDAYPSDIARAYGQKGRLIIPDLDTRRYCPYHPSDMLTYGWAQDVARFWLSMSHDTRDLCMSVYDTHGEENIIYMSKQYPVIETALAIMFMNHIGRPIEWTLKDSFAFYRDLFLIVSYMECKMFWFKRAWYNRVTFVGNHSQFITQPLWTAMIGGRPLEDFAGVDISKADWDDYLSDM